MDARALAVRRTWRVQSAVARTRREVATPTSRVRPAIVRDNGAAGEPEALAFVVGNPLVFEPGDAGLCRFRAIASREWRGLQSPTARWRCRALAPSRPARTVRGGIAAS